MSRRAPVLVFVWLSLWAWAAAAQINTPPLPAEVFFRHPDVLQAALSPSGNRLAVTTSRGTSRVGLAIFELGDAINGQRAAVFSDADIVSFQWVNDDRLVFSVVDLESGSGADRTEAPGLYAVNADGSNLRQLIARRWDKVVEARRAGPDALRWNHVLLHVPTPRSGAANDEVLVGTLVFAGGEVRHVQPQWLNVNTGRTRHYDQELPDGVVAWKFDSAGQPRVAITHSQNRRTVHWRGPSDKVWRVIGAGSGLGMPMTPHHVDDAGNLYVTHRQGGAGIAVLSRFDFDRGMPERDPFVSVEGFDFTGRLLGGGPGGRLLGVRVVSDAESTVWFDDQLKTAQQTADARLPGRINRLSCSRCGRDDMVVLVESYTDHDPGQIWLYRVAKAQWVPVARVMPGIDPARMGSVELHRVKARDGLDLPVWITLPPGHVEGRPSPAVVLVHGGPWVRGGRWEWSAQEQFLASRGYVVISPDFRGSRGYGDKHFRAGWKQWGRAMQDDVADALLWARGRGLVDQACIAGASYGGYSALMGLIRHPELYRCGVAWVAVTDPFLYLEGSFWVNDDISDGGRRYVLPELVGDAKADAEMLTAVSPVAQAARIRAPLLLGFGESDRRVPLAHGNRLRDALQKAGREPEWVTYPGEGHSWRLPETRSDFARRMERFLATHLAPGPN